MDKPEIIETNTCGYIKVDKLFINDVKDLKEEYLKIKESIINEILKELTETSKDVVSSDPSTPD
jgi:uncharacterized protein YfcZ (UPF0381/DUF406 family)